MKFSTKALAVIILYSVGIAALAIPDAEIADVSSAIDEPDSVGPGPVY